MTSTTARSPAEPRIRPQLHEGPGDNALTDFAVIDAAVFQGRALSAEPAEQIEIRRSRFVRSSLAGARWSRATVEDAAFEACDLSNFTLDDSAVRRVAIIDGRTIGMNLGGSTIRDLTMSGCRAPMTSFRFAKLRDVRFAGCVLSGADFQGSQLQNVAFEECELDGAQFSGVKVVSARFAGCMLAGIGGVTSLSGASVAESDLPGLAHALAAAIGIRIDQPS